MMIDCWDFVFGCKRDWKSTSFNSYQQRDQIGRFYLQKWPKHLVTFGALMKNLLFKQKLLLLLLGQLREKFGLLFILTSGHTGYQYHLT